MLAAAAARLARGEPARIWVLGSSMEPTVPGGSFVDLLPLSRPPVPGEVVLAHTDSGGLVLHRVRRWEGRVLVLKGDSARGEERVPESAVLGLAPGLRTPSAIDRIRHWVAPVLVELTTPTREGLEDRAAARYALESPVPDPGDEEGAEDWEKAFAALLVSGTEVLDLGCGGGREARALSGMGFRVTGLDPDAGAVEAARQRGGPARFEACFAMDLLDPARHPGPFGGILLTRGLYSLLPLSRRRVALLGALGRRLAPGGVLALHAWEIPPRIGPRRILVGILRVLLQVFAPGRPSWERGDRMLRYVTGTGLSGDWMFCHLFVPEELEAECREAGYAEFRRLEGGGVALSRFSSQAAAAS